MPKVSIITPTYNGERFIERAIKSVLWQTFNDWELIVVDDASTDQTVEIIKRYCEKDKRIKLIELKENTGGPAIPRTIACKEAKGKLIAFLDQDDIFYPEYLRTIVGYFKENPEVDILVNFAWSFDENTKKIINYEYGDFVVRNYVLKYAGYFKQEQNGADEVGMIYRYLFKSRNLNRLIIRKKSPLSLYSRHPNQGSNIENKDLSIFIKRILSLLNELDELNKKSDINHFKNDLYRKIRELQFYCFSRLGNFYALAGEMKNARKYFINSIRLKFNLFSFYFLLFTFFGYKIYRKNEFLLRQIQRKIFWRLKVFYYKAKYKESYAKALKILKEL